jgi:tRNA 2-thiouridine synthesizing protein A
MTIRTLDTTGLELHECIFKIAVNILDVKEGGILDIGGDCPAFEKNIRTWCEETGKDILSIESEGEDRMTIRIKF